MRVGRAAVYGDSVQYPPQDSAGTVKREVNQ